MLRHRRVYDDQGEVGINHRLITARNPQLFNAIVSFAYAGSVYKTNWNAIQRSCFRNCVACSTRDFGHNRSVLFNQAIEEATLSDVRPSHDGQRESVMHQPPVIET